MRRGFTVAVATAALALARVASAAPAPERGWGLPRDVSVHGWRVDWLMNSTTVFVTLMFLATVVWLVIACVRHGRRHRADYDPGSGRPQVIKAALLSAVIFAVVDGNLLLNGMADLGKFWNYDAVAADPRTVRVEINAHQWAWDVRYAGPDGVFNTADDVVTLNEVRVPVDTPVLVELASTDVIHSFSLPNLRVKQDAVPGMVNRLWFQAKQRGDFDIACAQHCGVHHYKMRGQLTVMAPADFQAWLTRASVVSQAGFDAQDRGAQWGWDWQRGMK